MEFKDLQKEWGVESHIDPTNLIASQAEQMKQIGKWLRYRAEERQVLRLLEGEYAKLKLLKTRYYLGEVPKAILDEKNWPPFPLRINKSDLEQWLNADQDLIDHSLKMGLSHEKVEYIEGIIRTLHNKNFVIKNILDARKFEHGER